MSFKPSDFFLGIVDLFGILMPGSLLWLWVNPLVKNGLPKEVLDQVSVAPVSWIVFLFASYLTGHIVSTFSGPIGVLATIIGDPMIDKLRMKNSITAMTSLRENTDLALSRMGWDEEHHKRRLISAYVQNKSTVAAADLERIRGVSRFFRSLTLVFIAIALLNIQESTREFTAYCIAIAAVTLWLYFYSHWKYRDTTYVYFLAQCLVDGVLQSDTKPTKA